MSDGQERTEPATPKRRERARADGEHARSLLAPCALGLAFAALPVAFGARFASSWVAFFDLAIRSSVTVAHAAPSALPALAAGPAAMLWSPAAAACAGASLAAFAAAMACGSLGWAPRTLRWRLSRVDPVSNIRSIASAETIAQTVFSLAAAIAVAAAASPAMSDVIAHAGGSWRAASLRAWYDLAGLWARCSAALCVVAAIDVILARRRFASRLRMTPREVRDERAEQEGRPEIRSRRRGIALRRSRRLRLEAIRRASAVVANPTHVAVALRYAPPAIDVPVVVALGAGASATIVRTIAAFHGVPVVESPDLARALFTRLEVDDPVPEDTYAAIAAIFAWILRTRGRLGGTADP